MEIEKKIKVLHIIAWVLCVGIIIKLGGIAISYFASIANPEASKNLYNGLNLSAAYQLSFNHYSFMILGKIVLLAIQAYIIFLVARFLKKINYSQPFNSNLLMVLNKINTSIINLWFATILFNIHLIYLKKVYNITYPLASIDFILLTVIIFILSSIFKRGIEIQQENELTI
ncbi:DUF2975 domain-containing protein [Pseudofulvibacter geojedonensis]|uniref:DUF2975 domain-containing protein n=1 Tax=Pseudofulvibacter geojedonensis TaxID=1123758 RepID=A0ABW3I4A3_9FLAO